jgi:delta-aminolevulinic acid dehydratase/porphobilinogen synthase
MWQQQQQQKTKKKQQSSDDKTTTIHAVRFEILTAALLRIRVFWDVMLCRWASHSHCFEATQCLHIKR